MARFLLYERCRTLFTIPRNKIVVQNFYTSAHSFLGHLVHGKDQQPPGELMQPRTSLTLLPCCYRLVLDDLVRIPFPSQPLLHPSGTSKVARHSSVNRSLKIYVHIMPGQFNSFGLESVIRRWMNIQLYTFCNGMK